jgi:hypothetical protein
MKLETFQDVVLAILPLAPTMSERDVADLLLCIHEDPSAGPDILSAYIAADAGPDGLSTFDEIWKILQIAATVAGVITSLAGAVELIP